MKKNDIWKEYETISVRKIISTVVIGIALIVIFLAIINIFKENLDAISASEGYEEVYTEAVDEESHTIDFSVIKATGSTSTSWIYIPDTVIDYPLVQGKNNDEYLATDAYGNESKAGAIFINFANSSDMSDAKTIIFGHDMSDGSMFRSLHYYSDEEYGYEHQDCYIYMDNGDIKHYRLLYYLFTDPSNSDVYVTSLNEVASEAAEKLKNDALTVFNEYTGGNLICLSTCNMHVYRTVIVFEEIDSEAPDSESSFSAQYIAEKEKNQSTATQNVGNALGGVFSSAENPTVNLEDEEESE